MRIRWKLLLLLLSISLLPLGIALTFGRREAVRASDQIVEQINQTLLGDAERFLLQTVRDQSRVMRRVVEFIDQNLRLQARDAEHCLDAAAPSDPRFHIMGEPPPKAADGSALTRFDYLGFYLAPGIQKSAVYDDMARLTRLLPAYQMVYRAEPEMILWQYVSLTNGVHCFYPGDGALPEGYDSRKRPWYVDAEKARRLTWSAPMVDLGTGQIVRTVSMPVFQRDGTILGVAGIDIRMSASLSAVDLPPQWRDAAKTFLVFPDAEKGKPIIRVHARPGYDAPRGADSIVPYESVTSPDAPVYAAVVDDLKSERAAVRVLPYEDRQSFWAYSAMPGTNSSLLVIVPHNVVAAPAISADKNLRLIIEAQRTWIAVLLAGVIVVIALLAVSTSRYVTEPIRDLAAAAQRIAGGDLDTPVRVRSRDEIGQLGRTMNAMLPQLRDRMRMREGLAIAQAVQKSLLPDGAPAIAGWDIAGISQFCDETGGDYYDFLDLSADAKGRFGVVVGDVTGHGIGAALMMATVRALLRAEARGATSLGDVLGRANDELQDLSARTMQIMTVGCLVFDAATRSVRWASAGHDPAILYDPQTRAFFELAGTGVPLGVDPTWKYTESGPREMSPGQVVVLGTDGIWEARNPAGDFFGKDRLKETIAANASRSAADICKAIGDAVAAFRGARTQDDDITIVAVRAAFG